MMTRTRFLIQYRCIFRKILTKQKDTNTTKIQRNARKKLSELIDRRLNILNRNNVVTPLKTFNNKILLNSVCIFVFLLIYSDYS